MRATRRRGCCSVFYLFQCTAQRVLPPINPRSLNYSSGLSRWRKFEPLPFQANQLQLFVHAMTKMAVKAANVSRLEKGQEVCGYRPLPLMDIMGAPVLLFEVVTDMAGDTLDIFCPIMKGELRQSNYKPYYVKRRPYASLSHRSPEFK